MYPMRLSGPASREFQVLVKPVGASCNLACRYCYYLSKGRLTAGSGMHRMPDGLLERYIVQHIEASPDPVICFSWHGGEPTLLGLDTFRKIAAMQKKHLPAGRRIANAIQTNGALLDDDWCRFLASEGFSVGLSLDGPEAMHDSCRVTKDRRPTHGGAMRGYERLCKHGVPFDILCVVHAHNVRHPAEVYGFFKRIGAPYVSFLPLVEPRPGAESGVSRRTVPSGRWGDFLCSVFDEWVGRDIGRIKVQVFEEAARTAFGQEHSLCIFRPVCGDVPVVERNGDFYSCDHYVDPGHRLGNIREIPLVDLIEHPVQRAFGLAKSDTLPGCCRTCEVRAMCNGECPKNRFVRTPDGEPGLNYLCAGYKRFFTHCRSFVSEVAAEWSRQTGGQAPKTEAAAQPGRNDPCPCGSGLKYKHCCMGR